jgi:hypothetical protein
MVDSWLRAANCCSATWRCSNVSTIRPQQGHACRDGDGGPPSSGCGPGRSSFEAPALQALANTLHPHLPLLRSSGGGKPGREFALPEQASTAGARVKISKSSWGERRTVTRGNAASSCSAKAVAIPASKDRRRNAVAHRGNEFWCTRRRGQPDASITIASDDL